MAWDSISLMPRSYRCQKQGFPFPAFLFQKHVVCGSCQMDDGLREDIGRSYSIDSHWFPLAQISCSSSAPSPLPTGSTGHQLTSTSASEKLPVSWEAELQILVNVSPSDSPPQVQVQVQVIPPTRATNIGSRGRWTMFKSEMTGNASASHSSLRS